jgi:FkbM family methyltransferase
MVTTRTLRDGDEEILLTTTAPDDAYFGHVAAGAIPPAVTVARCIATTDSVYLDAGANIGVCALFFARMSPAGRVVAFEPGSRAFADMTRSVQANEVVNVTCMDVALGASDGEAQLLVPNWNASGAFITNGNPASRLHSSNADVTETTVSVRSIDSVVTELGLTRVDFFKIDVEGHEGNVLDGASATLARFQPVTMVEFNVFTIAVFAGDNPLDFLLRILEQFPCVTAVDNFLRVETIVGVAGAYDLVHRCFLSGQVVDLICTWEPLDIARFPLLTQGRVTAS